MYRGKRNGFYSLVLGVFFNLISHFLLFGDNFGAMGFSMVASIIGLIIIVLFSLHLKYLEEE
jgi:protein-S-isoprenylcysteine O-methyltransferase Ste14